MKWENGATENMKIGNLMNFCEKYNIELEGLLRSAMARHEPYVLPPPDQSAAANQSVTDENELILGFRSASIEVKEMMLEIARKATEKQLFHKRSEIQ